MLIVGLFGGLWGIRLAVLELSRLVSDRRILTTASFEAGRVEYKSPRPWRGLFVIELVVRTSRSELLVGWYMRGDDCA